MICSSVYRIYREEGLSLRLKRPWRNKTATLRQPKQLAHASNEIWSMDFLADALFDGRKLRMLTVVDLYTGVPGYRSQAKRQRGRCRARAQRDLRPTWQAQNHQDRHWQRVHLQGDGQGGLRAGRGH